MPNNNWANWMRTKSALEHTYFADSALPEAYILYALQEFYICAIGLIDQHGIGFKELDRAAAGEVYFHFSRGRVFRRPEAALFQCWQQLVKQRPEKLLGPARNRDARHGPARRDARAPMSEAQLAQRVAAQREINAAMRTVGASIK